jgi:iron complex outermembrane receptor protein
VDLALRKRTGRVTGTLSLFANRFDDYIFERFTGEEEDGLAVIVFEQEEAEFYGAELQALVNLFQLANDSHLDLELSADSVRAELSDSGEPVPRIPPLRFELGLHYHWQKLRAFGEVVRAREQDRVSANETATEGYTLVNAGVSYRLFLGGQVLDLVLRGRNLTDEEARNHVSYLKDVAPLPGRDLGLAVRLTF